MRTPIQKRVEKVLMLTILLIVGNFILFGQLIPFLVSENSDFSVWLGAILAIAGIFGNLRMISYLFRVMTSPLTDENTNKTPDSQS